MHTTIGSAFSSDAPSAELKLLLFRTAMVLLPGPMDDGPGRYRGGSLWLCSGG